MAKATKGLKKFLVVGLILLGGICGATGEVTGDVAGEATGNVTGEANQEVQRVPYLEIGDTILFDLKTFDVGVINETLILKRKGE